MAKVSSAPRDVQFSQDDLLLLAKSFQDEKFRGLLGEFARELSDPIKQKQYENEVKEWEKQRGVDVVFLDPSPGFVVAVVGGGETEGEGDPVCLNICSSDVIQEPSLIKRKETASLGHSWSIPHAVTAPRKEVIAGEKQLLRELLRGLGAKKSQQSSSQLKQVFVYDVVFHPDTLHLAFSNFAMKRCVIQSALESVSRNYQLKVGNQKEILSVKYVGKPMKSVVKKVVDHELHENSEKLSYLKKSEDERTSADIDKTSNKADNQSTNAVKDEDRTMTPQYTIKHVNKVDLQDFALPLIPQSGPAWRPQALEVEVQLPGVLRASQVNAEVWQQALTLSTDSKPVYKLELPLPYPVDEDLSTAKFDVSTQKLTFVLSVIPASKKDFMPLPSPSSDSGIECEPGYRTNSDGDNSSEMSVSSQEDGSRDEDDDNSVFESAPSSPIRATLIPSYTLKQTEEDLHVVLNCGSILPSSVTFTQRSEKVRIQLSSIGGGQTRLNYGLTLVSSPHKFAESSICHKINNDNMEVTIKKANPGQWKTCQIGDGNCLATVSVETRDISLLTSKSTAVELAENTEQDGVKYKHVESMARKPRVVRAVSMCEGSPASPDIRFKGPTCSWPRGILKHRSRSLSESYLGTFSPLESMASLESSLDLDILDDRDGEESVEENMGSSLGEKKSVRFNDVVSRQLFRSNSSILGQKARKQKKNLNKKKRRERRLSESDRDSDVTQSYSDPGPTNGDLSGTTTTSDDDDDDETDITTEVEENLNVSDILKSASNTYDDDLDGMNNNDKVMNRQNTINHNDNDNSNNNNNINNNNNDNENDTNNDTGVKTSKKKRKNNKKKEKKFEPSNNFIFQLDIEP